MKSPIYSGFTKEDLDRIHNFLVEKARSLEDVFDVFAHNKDLLRENKELLDESQTLWMMVEAYKSEISVLYREKEILLERVREYEGLKDRGNN